MNIVLPILFLFIIAGVIIIIQKHILSKLSRFSIFITLFLASIYLLSNFIGHLHRFNYNAWYSSATHNLIDETITSLENGEESKVIEELKQLKEKMRVTYEVQGNYNELAQETATKLRDINKKHLSKD